ncbi:hypothetical protein ACOME3_000248 [Neoechinorhynchus agilis]
MHNKLLFAFFHLTLIELTSYATNNEDKGLDNEKGAIEFFTTATKAPSTFDTATTERSTSSTTESTIHSTLLTDASIMSENIVSGKAVPRSTNWELIIGAIVLSALAIIGIMVCIVTRLRHRKARNEK